MVKFQKISVGLESVVSSSENTNSPPEQARSVGEALGMIVGGMLGLPLGTMLGEPLGLSVGAGVVQGPEI